MGGPIKLSLLLCSLETSPVGLIRQVSGWQPLRHQAVLLQVQVLRKLVDDS